MQIEWTQNESEINHEIGLLKQGNRYKVSSQLGKQLVLQGKAKEIKEKKKEFKIKETKEKQRGETDGTRTTRAHSNSKTK